MRRNHRARKHRWTRREVELLTNAETEDEFYRLLGKFLSGR